MDRIQDRGRNRSLAVVDEYFRRADAGSDDLLELFADDFEFYFPKFGVSTGKQGFVEFLEGFAGNVAALRHKADAFRYLQAGSTGVVEGTTVGALQDGGAWDGGETAGGRFCSVFELDGEL